MNEYYTLYILRHYISIKNGEKKLKEQSCMYLCKITVRQRENAWLLSAEVVRLQMVKIILLSRNWKCLFVITTYLW